MILDAQNLFTGASGAPQAITATALSTDCIDLGTARDVGAGEPLGYFVQVVAAFNNLTSLTLEVVTGATVDGNGVIQSPTVVESAVVPLASLTANRIVRRSHIPIGVAQRYLGMRFTVTGTNPTTGSVVAGLVFGHQSSIVPAVGG